jgi:hypothetical protein
VTAQKIIEHSSSSITAKYDRTWQDRQRKPPGCVLTPTGQETQTKIAGNSINACISVKAVANANIAIGPYGDASFVSTSGPTTLVMNP